ncbi:MAG: hypothetical protein GY793_08200 [Proteobacteria bacterium]|nr:hypothetical protein [Pseudomonadota bacterium]
MTKSQENLKKLAKTSIPTNFVKKQNGAWEHHDWINFCSAIMEKGYTPIDFNKVGLLLEKKKSAYLEKNNS